MPYQHNCSPLIVILGPTGVGKTEISIHLAESFDGEIVSADSRLLYKGMDIGTAKPSLKDRTRVPHHLIDVADPNQIWSLAKYQQAAYAAINEIHDRDKLPFLVGGTGQYIMAIIQGWDIPPVKPNPRLRAALQNWAEELGHLELHHRLSVVDPIAAAQIEPQNLRRTIRALEVVIRTGFTFSSQKRRSGCPFQAMTLGIDRPRSELYARIDDRIQAMIDCGLVNEVKSLLDDGYSPDLPPMSAIGYRQIVNYIQGKITLEEAKTIMKRLTRQYVRRQANWFKLDDPNITWFQVGPEILNLMGDTISQFIHQQEFTRETNDLEMRPHFSDLDI